MSGSKRRAAVEDEDMDCPHIDEAVKNLDVEEMRLTLKNRSCNVCLRVDELWICMECRQILCGPNAAGHSTAHFEYHKHHCITLNIESAAIFCYKCETEVVEPKHDDKLNRVRQFILYNQGPSKVNKKKNKKRQKKQNSVPTEKKVCKKPKNTTPAVSRTNWKLGLSNLGNSCFMNAVLQSLSHMNPFVYCLKHIPEEYLVNNNNINNNNPNIDPKDIYISEELVQILTRLSDWKRPSSQTLRCDPIIPQDFYKLICQINNSYRGYHQHDAHEFLIFMLNKVSTELKDSASKDKSKKSALTSTIINYMFGGTLLSEVCCLKCKVLSRKSDPVIDLSLDIPECENEESEADPIPSLTDCLTKYIAIEELKDNNFYSCLNCNSLQRCTKKFWLSKLPNILCLHLKRFRFMDTQRLKVHTRISFPLDSLDMSHFLANDVTIPDKEEEYLYDLLAVIVHDGNGGGSGHYTAFALDDIAEKWFQYNDNKVHLVEDISVVLKSQAYVLFYIKREMRLRMRYGF